MDIDAYDYRNQERMERLRGHVDDTFFKRMAGGWRSPASPAARRACAAARAASEVARQRRRATEAGREMQALEDLIVQTEIFLQYSLHNKALERLQKIAAMFPGEEERQRAAAKFVSDWRIGGRQGAHRSKSPPPASGCAAGRLPPRSGAAAQPLQAASGEQDRDVHGGNAARSFEDFRRSIRRFSGSRRRERC